MMTIYPTLAEMLPSIKVADDLYSSCLYAVESNEDVEACVAEYNKILRKAVHAIWLDTKHVNALGTIHSVYVDRLSKYDTIFGISPFNYLCELVGEI